MQAGGFPHARPSLLEQQAGQGVGTHAGGQAAGADGWVNLGCQEAATSFPRENKVRKLYCTAILLHQWQVLPNRDEQTNKITLHGSIYEYVPYSQIFINSLQLRLRL